jgi:tetratricopeptide (TPR) repeat protein
MKTLTSKLLAAIAALAIMVPVSAMAQSGTNTVHGHVTNPAGFDITSGTVEFTKDRTEPEDKMRLTNPTLIGKDGNYNVSGVLPGDYYVYVIQDGKRLDRMDLSVKVDENRTLDFDMSRPEYLSKMTPEERAALEEYKKKTAAALSTNKVVANLNNLLKQVYADLALPKPNYDADIKLMQQATEQKPDEAVLWLNLGQVLTKSADAQVKQAKLDKKPWQSDDTIIKQYTDGIAAYKKGIDLNLASKKPVPADIGISWNSIGNAYAKMGKLPESQDAFESAVKAAPTTAGMVYGNEAAVLFNANQSEAAGVAADKAIAADPTKPDPYYIKGQSLVGGAKLIDNKYVLPPGCAEAYQKYLELAPNGEHAAEVRDLMTSLGQTVNTKYKAPPKK